MSSKKLTSREKEKRDTQPFPNSTIQAPLEKNLKIKYGNFEHWVSINRILDPEGFNLASEIKEIVSDYILRKDLHDKNITVINHTLVKLQDDEFLLAIIIGLQQKIKGL